MGPWSLIEVGSANQNRPLLGNFKERSNWKQRFWTIFKLGGTSFIKLSTFFWSCFQECSFLLFLCFSCHFQLFLLPGSESPYLEVGLCLTWRKYLSLVHAFSWELFQECWRSFRIWKIWTFLQIWNARKNNWNGWSFNCFFHVWKFGLHQIGVTLSNKFLSISVWFCFKHHIIMSHCLHMWLF